MAASSRAAATCCFRRSLATACACASASRSPRPATLPHGRTRASSASASAAALAALAPASPSRTPKPKSPSYSGGVSPPRRRLVGLRREQSQSARPYRPRGGTGTGSSSSDKRGSKVVGREASGGGTERRRRRDERAGEGGGECREEKNHAFRVQIEGKNRGGKRMVCYDCGAAIVPRGEERAQADGSSAVGGGVAVTVARTKSGYWAERQEKLRKSKISNWALCQRCRALNKKGPGGGAAAGGGGGAQRQHSPTGPALEAFRSEVGKVRSEKAVVVLVVDAVNTSGTVVGTLREYVGGNPILLAVTRCDLLPPFLQEGCTSSASGGGSGRRLYREVHEKFAERAKGLDVAEVFTVSIPPDAASASSRNRNGDDDRSDGGDRDADGRGRYGGVPELAASLLSDASGRDVYVVGAANIGKSTLTDALVEEMIYQQGEFKFRRDRLASKRLDALRSMRVTKSALPGTTLQNVRVPCFVDHERALWDTPGLVLDEARAHFPIRGFDSIVRSDPRPVVPTELEADAAAFCVEVFEAGEDEAEAAPLLRVLVRLRRTAAGGGGGGGEEERGGDATRLAWNSVYGLDARIVERPPLASPPPLRKVPAEEERMHAGSGGNEEELEVPKLTKEERVQRKEQRRREYLARVKEEQEELGMAQWKRREKERREREFEERRETRLSKLTKVAEIVVSGDTGTDVSVGGIGWFSLAPPRDAKLEVFAPSSGVKVSAFPSLALPSSWGIVCDAKSKEEVENEDEYNEDEEWFEEDNDDGEWRGDYNDGEWLGIDSDFPHFEDDQHGYEAVGSDVDDRVQIDAWRDHAGKRIGWEFLSQRGLKDGWSRIQDHEGRDWMPPRVVTYDIKYPVEERRRGWEKGRRGAGGRKQKRRIKGGGGGGGA